MKLYETLLYSEMIRKIFFVKKFYYDINNCALLVQGIKKIMKFSLNMNKF